MPFLKNLLRPLYPLYRRTLGPAVRRLFFMDLITQTRNFRGLTWMGQPIWQNILDLWTIQETIIEVKPELLIECGTNRGGSALFFAHLFDLMGAGRVITIDIEKMHEITHPRITFLIGSTLAPSIVETVSAAAGAAKGPVLVILDDDHSAKHVREELEVYARFVTLGSFMLVQDGMIDLVPTFREGRPGPLPAIREFLQSHPEFEVDRARTDRFLITHHPMGWLRKRPASEKQNHKQIA
jgi:cephalosporin hydroxylase